MPPQRQQLDPSPAVSSAVLTPKRITVLTDAVMKAFDVFYDIERQQHQEAKLRLAAVLHRLDLFSPGEHYADHESYVPGRNEQ